MCYFVVCEILDKRAFLQLASFCLLCQSLELALRTHNLLHNISVWNKIHIDDEMLLNKMLILKNVNKMFFDNVFQQSQQ